MRIHCVRSIASINSIVCQFYSNVRIVRIDSLDSVDSIDSIKNIDSIGNFNEMYSIKSIYCSLNLLSIGSQEFHFSTVIIVV